MVDRIEKLDPKAYRVHESTEEKNGRQQEYEEEGKKEKEKDKFEKGIPSLKKLIPDTEGKVGGQLANWDHKTIASNLGSDTSSQAAGAGRETEREETSLSLSQRMLVLWGVIDLKGRPRMPVIGTYLAVLLVILLSVITIVRILWR